MHTTFLLLVPLFSYFNGKVTHFYLGTDLVAQLLVEGFRWMSLHRAYLRIAQPV